MTCECGVVVVADDGPTGVALVEAMVSATIAVEWTRTLAELRERAARNASEPGFIVVDLELAGTSVDALLTLVLDSFPISTIVALAEDLTGDRGAKLLSQGVLSLPKPVSPDALAALALRMLLGRTESAPVGGRGSMLESLVALYSETRELSKQQQMILRLYLSGMNDKEIAESCRCSEATVYEHWRRMARKARGTQKSDAIADFHRFLATN